MEDALPRRPNQSRLVTVVPGVDGNNIAGRSPCLPEPTEDTQMGWPFLVSLRRRWQRLGLALACLQHRFGGLYGRSNGR